MKILDIFIRMFIFCIFSSTFVIHFYIDKPAPETIMVGLLDSNKIQPFQKIYSSYPGAELWSFGHFAHRRVHFVAGDIHDAFKTFIDTYHEKMLLVWTPFPVTNFKTPETIIEYMRNNKTLAMLWNKETAKKYALQNIDWRRWCHIENIKIEKVFV